MCWRHSLSVFCNADVMIDLSWSYDTIFSKVSASTLKSETESPFHKSWSLIIIGKCCRFIYGEACRLMWWTTLHTNVSVLEAFSKHILTCFCTDLFFTVIVIPNVYENMDSYDQGNLSWNFIFWKCWMWGEFSLQSLRKSFLPAIDYFSSFVTFAQFFVFISCDYIVLQGLLFNCVSSYFSSMARQCYIPCSIITEITFFYIFSTFFIFQTLSKSVSLKVTGAWRFIFLCHLTQRLYIKFNFLKLFVKNLLQSFWTVAVLETKKFMKRM